MERMERKRSHFYGSFTNHLQASALNCMGAAPDLGAPMSGPSPLKSLLKLGNQEPSKHGSAGGNVMAEFEVEHGRLPGFHAVEEIADVRGPRIAAAFVLLRFEIGFAMFDHQLPTFVVEDDRALRAAPRNTPRTAIDVDAKP